MVKIGTLITNPAMEMGDNDTRLSPIRGAFLLAGKLRLLFDELLFSCSKVSGVFDRFAFGREGKELDPHVYANSFL